MSKYYAGIGSRETPTEILYQMADLAKELHAAGYSLRSGHADGADMTFEMAVCDRDQEMQIFLPWPKFNGAPERDSRYISAIPHWAYQSVDRYHPASNRLTMAGRKLMARNAMQIFGPNGESPVKFVVCYTKDGQASGGTGQAIRIAQKHRIPVYNLHNEVALGALRGDFNL